MRLFGRLYAAGYDVVGGWLDGRGGVQHRRRLVADAPGEVLEIGAGTGRNLSLYEHARRVVALEPEPGMRWRAERRATGARVEVEVLEGDAMALTFPDGSFDTVVASLVFCTIPEPRAALAEAHRVLRANGTLRFYEHVRATDPKLARLQDRFCRPWMWFGRGCHPNRATVSLIASSGFRIAELDRFDFRAAPRLVRPHVLGLAKRQ